MGSRRLLIPLGPQIDDNPERPASARGASSIPSRGLWFADLAGPQYTAGVNTRAAIISLLLVLLLAGAAAIMLRPAAPAAKPSPSWLSTLDTLPVTRLEFRKGDQIAVEVRRRDGMWMVHTPDASQPDWPADEARVRGLLRLLASTAAAPGSPAVGSHEETLTIVTDAGQPRTLSARVEAVGGTGTLTTLDDPAGVTMARSIDPGLASAMRAAGVATSWKRLSAFPSDTSGISRVRVESAGMLLEIARVRGLWNVLLPFPTPGAQDACNALSTTLTRLPAERLIGTPDESAQTWARSPTAFIELEQVEPGESRRRLIQELRVGGAADPAGTTLIALAGAHWMDTTTNAKTAAWGPMLLTVRRDTIEAIHPDLAAFASRESIQTPRADIAGLWFARCGTPDALDASRPLVPPRSDTLAASEFSGVRLTRTLDGWRRISVGTTGAILGDSEAALLPTLLNILSSTPAAGIFADRPQDCVCLGAMVVTDIAGETVAIVGLGFVKGGPGGTGLVVRSGRLWRVYAVPDAAAVAAWINELLREEG